MRGTRVAVSARRRAIAYHRARMPVDAAATIRKTKLRLLTPLLALLFLSTIDRANISFAALQMNADLGPDRRDLRFRRQHLLRRLHPHPVAEPLAAAADRHAALGVRVRRAVGTRRRRPGLRRTPRTAFYALRLLLGIAEGGFAPGVMFYLAQWIPARYRAGAISTFMLAVPVSAICRRTARRLVDERRQPDRVAGLALDAADRRRADHCCLRWRRCGCCPTGRAMLAGCRAESGAGSKTRSRARRPRTPAIAAAPVPLGNGRLWIASACWFGLMAGANGLLYWLPQIMRHLSASSTELQIGLITALPWIAVAAGMVLNAWHSDRAQERHWHVGLAALARGGIHRTDAAAGHGRARRWRRCCSPASRWARRRARSGRCRRMFLRPAALADRLRTHQHVRQSGGARHSHVHRLGARAHRLVRRAGVRHRRACRCSPPARSRCCARVRGCTPGSPINAPYSR